MDSFDTCFCCNKSAGEACALHRLQQYGPKCRTRISGKLDDDVYTTYNACIRENKNWQVPERDRFILWLVGVQLHLSYWKWHCNMCLAIAFLQRPWRMSADWSPARPGRPEMAAPLGRLLSQKFEHVATVGWVAVFSVIVVKTSLTDRNRSRQPVGVWPTNFQGQIEEKNCSDWHRKSYFCGRGRFMGSWWWQACMRHSARRSCSRQGIICAS